MKFKILYILFALLVLGNALKLMELTNIPNPSQDSSGQEQPNGGDFPEIPRRSLADTDPELVDQYQQPGQLRAMEELINLVDASSMLLKCRFLVRILRL
jgi:hypothetical protein